MEQGNGESLHWTNLNEIKHYSKDANSCYGGTCKNSNIFYGPKDITIDRTPFSECFAYYFKKPRNEAHNPECRIYDKKYLDSNLGFRLPSNSMHLDTDLFQVGIHSCHNIKLQYEWNEAAQSNQLFSFITFI